jgi:hypothetical protein
MGEERCKEKINGVYKWVEIDDLKTWCEQEIDIMLEIN